MQTKPSLIIFDCDGVLVDSETLSANVLMAEMERAGMPITLDIFRSDFLGRSLPSAAERVLERFGRPLPLDFEAAYHERLFTRMKVGLQRMPGVEDMLRAVTMPYCLATGSKPERLAVTLAASGLGPWFEGRCYTTAQVARGKPAPDLFHFIAAEFGVNPSHTLVIEDSEMGVRAALAAGMTVWQFVGGSHMAGWQLPGGVIPHRVIADMAELKQVLAAFD